MLTLNKSSFDQGISQAEGQAEGFGSKLKSGLASAAKTAATAIVAASAAVGSFAKQSLNAYGDYEQLVGGIETLFGAGGQSLDEYAAAQGKSIDEVSSKFAELQKSQEQALSNAANAYKTAGLSANEYMETVTSFAASLKQSLGENSAAISDYADLAITDMSDNANKMGTAMESIQNAYQGFAKQNYTMLDNLKLGYGGTKEEMERLLRDAEELEGLEIGSLDVSNFADVVTAIHAVQTELGITGTTAKEASSTIQGSISSLTSAWQNLVVGIADENADLSGLMSNVVESVVTVGENVIPRFQQILSGIGEAVKNVAPIIGELIPSILTDVFPSILETGIGLVDAFIDGISSNAEQLATAATKIGLKLVDGIGSALPKVATAALDIIKTLSKSLADNAKTIAETAVNIVTDLALAITEPDTLTSILDAGLQIIVGLAQGLLEAIPTLIESLPLVIDNIVTFILDSIPLIIDAGVQLLTSLVSNMDTIINSIVSVIPVIINNLVNSIIGAIPQIVESGVKLLVSLVQNLPTIITNIVTVLPNLILGIVDGILSDGNLEKIIMAGVQLFVSLIQNLPTIIFEIVKAVPQIIDGIVSSFGSLTYRIVEIGGNIISGIWEGISGAADWLFDQVDGFFGGLVDGVCGFLGIHSPSKVFEGIGENMALGVGEGFSDEFKGIKDDINGQMDFSGTASFDLNRDISTSYSGAESVYNASRNNAATETRERQPLIVVVQLESGLELARALIEDINDAKRIDGYAY